MTGPFTFAVLAAMYRNGRLMPSYEVSEDRQTWLTVEELFNKMTPPMEPLPATHRRTESFTNFFETPKHTVNSHEVLKIIGGLDILIIVIWVSEILAGMLCGAAFGQTRVGVVIGVIIGGLIGVFVAYLSTLLYRAIKYLLLYSVELDRKLDKLNAGISKADDPTRK